jgi:hypothetical protein
MPEHDKAAQKPVVESKEPTTGQDTAAPVSPVSLTLTTAPKPQHIVGLQRLIGNRATRTLLKSAQRKEQQAGKAEEFANEEWIPVESEAPTPAYAPPPPPIPMPSRAARLAQQIQREGEGTTPPPAGDGKTGLGDPLDVIPPSSNSRWALLSEVMDAVKAEEKAGKPGLASKTAYIIVTSAVYGFDSNGNRKISASIKPDSSFPSPGYYLSVRGYPVLKVLARKSGKVQFSDFTVENAANTQIIKWIGAESYKQLQAFLDSSGSQGIIMVVNPGNDPDDDDSSEEGDSEGSAEAAKGQVKQVSKMISQLRKDRAGKSNKGSGGTDPNSKEHAGPKKEYDSLPDGVWHQEQNNKQYVILTVDGALRRVEIQPNDSPVELLKRIENATVELRKSRDPEQSVGLTNGAKDTGMVDQAQFGETTSGEQKPPATGASGGGASPAVVGERYDNLSANAPPYPARIVNYGSDITVIGASNRFSMEIDFGMAGGDLLSQVTARMQPIHYYWELIDVTNVKPEQRKEVGEKTSVGSNQAVRATSGAASDLMRGLEAAGEDTLNDLKDLSKNPETMMFDWPARSAWLGVIAVSNVVQIGGSLISSYISLVSTPLNERSIGFDREGDFLIRCVATPVPSDRVPPDQRIVRASSIRAIPIRVQKVNERAKQALEEKPEDIAAMEKQLKDMQDGDAKKALQDKLKSRLNETTPQAVERQLKDTDEKLRVLYDLESFDREKKPREQRTIAARMLDVQLQLLNIPRDTYRRGLEAQAKQLAEILESTQKLGGKIKGANYRPDVVLASEENGQVIKMLMMLGEGEGSKDGKRVYNLIDVTSPKTRAVYDGRSTKTGNDGHTEAIRNAFVNFRENNGYGRGTIAIKLPQKLQEDLGFQVAIDAQMRSAPGQKERVMNRLRDLATAAEIAGMILAGPVGLAVGVAGGVAGGIVAVHNMAKRANGERLTWDFETIMDITAVVGAAMSVVQLGSFAAGQTKRFSKMAQKVDNGLHVFGVGMMAGQVVFIPAGLILQFEEIEKAAKEQNLPPGEVAARRAEALLGAVKSGVVTVISAGGGFGYDPLAPKAKKSPADTVPEGGSGKPVSEQTPPATPAPIIPDVPSPPVPRDGDTTTAPTEQTPAPQPKGTPTRSLTPTPKAPAKVTAVTKSSLAMEIMKALGMGELPQTGRIRITDNLDAQWQAAKGSAMPADALGFRDTETNILYLDRARMTPDAHDLLMKALKQRANANRLARSALGDAVCDSFVQHLLELLFHDPQYQAPARGAGANLVDLLILKLETAVGAQVLADAILNGTVPGLRAALTETYGAARASAIEALIKNGQPIRASLLLETPNNTARSTFGETFSAGIEDMMAVDAGGKARNAERLGVMREIAGIVGIDALTMALLKGDVEPVRKMLDKALGPQLAEQLIKGLKEGNLVTAKKALKGELEALPEGDSAKTPAKKSKKDTKQPDKTTADVKQETKTDTKDTAPQSATPAAQPTDTPTPKHQLGKQGAALKDALNRDPNGDHQALAETVIKEAGSFKKLREMVAEGLFGTGELIDVAKNQLQKARIELTNRIVQEVIDSVKARYPNIEITLEDMGTPGFNSDRDATAKADGKDVDVRQKVKASAEVVDLAYKKLRELGLDPDLLLDSNFYTELHEGSITATPEEAKAIAYDQSVVSLAEQRMQMDDAQWRNFREQQLAALPAKDNPSGLQDRLTAEARKRVEQQLNAAENLVETRLGGNGTSSPAERKILNERRLKLLEQRRQELIEMMGRTPPAGAREIRALMAEVKMLEPDAYGTRAAKEGVVDTQQGMARAETTADANKIWDKRQTQKAGSRAELFQRMAQEASASLAKMFGHAKPKNNSASDVRALAKYLARIYHAFQEAGLGKVMHPFVDRAGNIIATKLETLSDAATLRELRAWAQDNNMGAIPDAELLDRFVAESQKLGQDITTRLRTAEMMDHVFDNPGDIAPKDTSPDLWKTGPVASDAKQHEAYKDSLRSQMQKPTVIDADLKKIVDANYRDNAKIGSGSTADAIRHERATGGSVGGREHTQKGEDTIRGLQYWLDKHPLDEKDAKGNPLINTPEAFSQRKNDRAAAENMIKDLQDALASAKKAQ